MSMSSIASSAIAGAIFHAHRGGFAKSPAEAKQLASALATMGPIKKE
ncbi:MAG: hypothetical protein Q7R91_01470 [bacterium]|nr:hypothetical protein [bacterium]